VPLLVRFLHLLSFSVQPLCLVTLVSDRLGERFLEGLYLFKLVGGDLFVVLGALVQVILLVGDLLFESLSAVLEFP